MPVMLWLDIAPPPAAIAMRPYVVTRPFGIERAIATTRSLKVFISSVYHCRLLTTYKYKVLSKKLFSMKKVIVIGLGADYGPGLRRMFVQHLAVAEPSLLRIHGCETESSVVIISDIVEQERSMQEHESVRMEEMLIKNIAEHFTEISVLVHDCALYEQSPALPSCCTPRIAKAIVHICQYSRIRPPPFKKSGRFFYNRRNRGFSVYCPHYK